jgi:hypothetical protein
LSGGNEGMPQGVRAGVLGDPRTAADPGGAVPVQPLPLHCGEQRPLGALADGQVDRAGGARS